MKYNHSCYDTPIFRARQQGFTLVELLVVIAIVAALAALSINMAKRGMAAAAQANEVKAAKNLLVAYGVSTASTGHYLPGYDKSINEVALPSGKVVGGPIAARYPFRLAAATDISVQQISLLGNNKKGIGDDEDYLISLYPTFGINRYFIGGDVQSDGSVSYDNDCLTNTSQASASIIVFASAGTSRNNDSVIEGYNHITPPNLISPMWPTRKWDREGNIDDYGNIHARHNGKAVVGFLDGSVRLQGLEDLRDMRLWSYRANDENKPDYRVPRTGGGRF